MTSSTRKTTPRRFLPTLTIVSRSCLLLPLLIATITTTTITTVGATTTTPTAAFITRTSGQSLQQQQQTNQPLGFTTTGTTTTTTVHPPFSLVGPLFSSSPGGRSRPPPRRNLKKRRGRENRDRRRNPTEDDFPWETSESRALIKERSIEQGTDYWIDEADLIKDKERNEAIKNRKAVQGQISKEKLRTEMVAPYQQNWIGYFSVMIVVFVTLMTQIPELTDPPPLPYPDL